MSTLVFETSRDGEPSGRITKIEVHCPCGTAYENVEMYLHHKRHCPNHVEQRSEQTPNTVATSEPCSNSTSRNVKSNPGTSSVAAMGVSTSTMKPRIRSVHCDCGRNFANEKQLTSHVQYSKTHRLNKPGSTSKTKSAASAPATSPTLASGPLLAGNAAARNEEADDCLISYFASLKVGAMTGQQINSVTRFACQCGAKFTTREELSQHRHTRGRAAWPEDGGRRDKKFNTPRPPYQEDQDLHEVAALLAKQCLNDG